MRTLILDNSVQPVFMREGRLTRRWFEETPQVVDAVRQPLPPSDSFDRLVLTGSEASVLDEWPWIHREIKFVQRAIDDGKPVLGICFGHQLLARACWGRGRVRHAKEPEFGWRKIRLDIADPLFAGLAPEVVAFCSHFDEVHNLPPDAVILAASDQCPVQAFRMRGQPVWGIQFHPEMDRLGGWAILVKAGLHQRQIPLDWFHWLGAADGPRHTAAIFGNFTQVIP